jgi:O-antigen/teichoic acid export membrane protein
MSSTGDTVDGHRRILNSISTGLGVTIFVSLLGAVAVRAMTTHLGASAFGVFVLIQAFVSISWNITDLGLSQVLQRDIARGDQDERHLLSHALGLRVTIGLIAVPISIAIGLLVYAHRSNSLKIGLVLLLFSIPFMIAQDVSSSHFNAQLRNAVLAIGSMGGQVIYVGLIILFIAIHKSITYCVAASLIGGVASALFIIVAARREVKFYPAFERATWSSMLRISTPIGLAYIIGTLYLKADTIILSFLSTVKQIGYYGVSYSIVSIFLVLPVVLNRTFIPSLARATRETLDDAVRSSMAFCAVGGTLGAAGVIVCAPTVVRIVAGTHFEPAVPPLRILGLGLIFIFMTNGLSNVCLARGYTNKLFVMSAISLVLNVGLNIAAIPRFGINGAATATLVCEVLSTAFMVYLVSSQVKVHPQVVGVLIRPLVAGMVACLVLAPIYLRSDLNVGIGLALIPAVLVIYFIVLALLRAVPPEVRSYLRPFRRSE